MVLDAPPAPRLLPDRLWPTSGGSGDGWGGDGGDEGGGGWWGEEPEEWEADAEVPYRHSPARRAATLITVLVVGLASVGGFLLLLIGSSSGAALDSRVVSVKWVGGARGKPAASAQVAFSVTNTAHEPGGARCGLSVFDGDAEIGSATVVSSAPIAVGSTVHGSVLVPVAGSSGAGRATIECAQASSSTSK